SRSLWTDHQEEAAVAGELPCAVRPGPEVAALNGGGVLDTLFEKLAAPSFSLSDPTQEEDRARAGRPHRRRVALAQKLPRRAAAVRGREPRRGVPRVLGEGRALDGVEHPLPVGREQRSAGLGETELIVHRHRPLDLLSRCRRAGEQDYEAEPTSEAESAALAVEDAEREWSGIHDEL